MRRGTNPDDLQTFTEFAQRFTQAEIAAPFRRKKRNEETRDENYSATSKLSAKGHCSSTHCARQRKPAFRAKWETSPVVYLWLLSLQMVSPSPNSTTNPPFHIVTYSFPFNRHPISI